MSDRNFWEKVNCLLIVVLYSLEAVAPHPQKGDIKFMKFFYIYIYVYMYIYIYIYICIYIYIYDPTTMNLLSLIMIEVPIKEL